jgi:hypothetical protein
VFLGFKFKLTINARSFPAPAQLNWRIATAHKGENRGSLHDAIAPRLVLFIEPHAGAQHAAAGVGDDSCDEPAIAEPIAVSSRQQ